MAEPLIVCLFGEAGSGKSDLARLLAAELNTVTLSVEVKPGDLKPGERRTVSTPPTPAFVYGFTRPLKVYVLEQYGLSKGDPGWRRAIHQAAGEFPPSVPKYPPTHKTLGTDWYKPNYHLLCERLWLARWERTVAETFPHARFIIADDARTEHEFAEAKRLGWVTVLVTGRRRYGLLHPHHWLPTERSVRRLARRHRRALAKSINNQPLLFRGEREALADSLFKKRCRDEIQQNCFTWEVENVSGPNWIRAQARRLAEFLRERKLRAPRIYLDS